MSHARYPVTITFDVHWGDMDAFGHVNNARYFTWFESCRTAYFARIGLRTSAPSTPGPILARISCDYRSPVVWPAKLVCGARVPRIGNTSFAMDYALWQSDSPDEPCARAESVVVVIDYATMRKMRVPDDIRRGIEELEASA